MHCTPWGKQSETMWCYVMYLAASLYLPYHSSCIEPTPWGESNEKQVHSLCLLHRSWCILIICQLSILPTVNIGNRQYCQYCQLSIMSTVNIANCPYCQLSTLPTVHIANCPYCQLSILQLSILTTVNITTVNIANCQYCQLPILPTVNIANCQCCQL